ncbi:putative ribonuclease H-like domain-containing protein [Tanacetum coccineum]
MDITIFYRPGVVCDQHNHRPTEHLEGHAYVRRLSDDEFCLVEELTWKNVPPREILSTLKDQDETNLSTLPTIYKAQKKIHKVERDGKTPMQVLMSILVDNRVLRYIQEKKQSYPARLFGVDLNVEPERHSSYTNNKQQEKKQSYSCKSFGIDPNMQPRRHSSFSKSQRGRTHNLIPDLNEEPPRHISFVSQTSTLHYFEISKSKRLRRQIPIVFHPYISISSLQDVKPDGNCGFRSVALGLGLPEDHWPRIRSDLVCQLESRQHQYRSIFGTRGYNQIYSSVRLVGEWMEIPHTGLVIASAYNKLVVSLSNDGGCATSFPLWSSPPQSDSNEIIVIAYVNGDHYIRVALRKCFPLPITRLF